MGDMVLTGYVETERGPEVFEVYRYYTKEDGYFTIVDLIETNHGRVTLNASGGLAGFAGEYGKFYRSLEDYHAKVSQSFPSDL